MTKIFNFFDYKRGGNGMIAVSNSIEEKAENILKEYGLHTLPIDPLLITANEDIDVFKVSFNSEDISGIIRKQEDSVRIYLKEHEYIPRQRFTLAHELGHFYLHLKDENGNFVDGNDLFARDNRYNKEEIEANQFAAALLMPRKQFIKLYNEGCSYRELSDIFDVSLPAIKKRIETLKLNGELSER